MCNYRKWLWSKLINKQILDRIKCEKIISIVNVGRWLGSL